MKKDLGKLLRAEEHDGKLALACTNLTQSVVEIGKELAIMRDEELWREVRNKSGERVESWREYVKFRLGSMSTSKMYEYLSAASLIHGEKPMAVEQVEKLGIKKATQVARLPEHKRTKKLLKQIEKESVAGAKLLVESVLEQPAPKVILVPLTIALPQEVIELINQIERDGQFLESVRDNDRSWTLRAKLWHQVWWDFLNSHTQELKAAAMYRETFLAAKKTNSEALASQSVN
jgi:hypothetical protein